MKNGFYKKIQCLFLFFILAVFITSCGDLNNKGENQSSKKGEADQAMRTEVSFHVCKEEELPDELKKMIEERKESAFELIYENSVSTYLAVGYGKQPGGEYVAAVRDIYETEESIMAEMVLISLSYAQDKEAGETSLYPYIVLRMEKKEKPVFFL